MMPLFFLSALLKVGQWLEDHKVSGSRRAQNVPAEMGACSGIVKSPPLGWTCREQVQRTEER